MTADDIDGGLPRLPIVDGTKQSQQRPAPSKLTLADQRRGSSPGNVPAMRSNPATTVLPALIGQTGCFRCGLRTFSQDRLVELIACQ